MIRQSEKESFFSAYKKNRKVHDFYYDPNLIDENTVFLGEVLSYSIDKFSVFAKFDHIYRFVIRHAHNNRNVGEFTAFWIREDDNKTCISSDKTFTYEDIFTWDYQKSTDLLRKYEEYERKAFRNRL